MADDKAKNVEKLGIIIGSSTLAATVAMLLKPSKASASGAFVLDEAAMTLLAAIAASSVGIEDKLELLSQILEAIKGINGEGGLAVPPEYPNNQGMTVAATQGTLANTPYRLPEIEVPEGRSLVIKGDPGNAGLVRVGFSASSSVHPLQSWPLRANEAVSYRIKNSKELFVSFTIANEIAYFTVEQD